MFKVYENIINILNLKFIHHNEVLLQRYFQCLLKRVSDSLLKHTFHLFLLDQSIDSHLF